MTHLCRFTSIKTPDRSSRRHVRLSTPQVILVNLALALLLFYMTFLAGSQQTDNNIMCRLSSALSLYFLLVAFGWMLVEGVVHYFVTVIVIYNFSPRRVLKIAIATWGEFNHVLHLNNEFQQIDD